MESGSPGNGPTTKLIHPGGIWSSDPSLRTSVTEGQDSTNNSQFLFIAVEYVNDGNVDYSNINTAPTFTSNQEFSELGDHLNPLDSSINSSENEYSFISNQTLNNSTTFNQNSIVILPNNSSEHQNGFSLNSVDGNMDLLRQVVTNRLCRQIENSIDLKQENESVELLITNQNTGLSYSLNSDTTNIQKQNDIMLNNLDTNNGDRILESESLVLDSNHLLSLDEHVLMDNGTLVLKSDLNSELNNVVQHIDLNLETNISQTIDESYKTIEDPYMQQHIDNNDVSNENPQKSTNFGQAMELKIEQNDYVKDEDIIAEETIQVRRSKRHQYDGGKEFDDDDDSDSFTDCQDCIMGSSLLLMCDRHRMLSISDKPVPSRARATLPGAYLSINKVGTDKNGEPIYGVFSRKFIPKRTQFGPIEGVVVKDTTVNVQFYNDIELTLENESGQMYKMDISNEDLSNWMRFVRKAEKFKDQNLMLNQMGPSLYYISTCNILPRQELLVGYSAVYAEKRSLTVLPNEPNKEEWPCFECDSTFVSFDVLDKHLNSVHGSENSAEKRLSRMKRSKKKRSEVLVTKKVDTLKCVKAVESDINGIVSSTEKDPLSEKENEEKVFYTCKDCRKVFELSILLEIHSETHNLKGVVDTSVTSSSDEQYICPECEVIFSSRTNLAYHVNDHQVRTAKIKCNICYKSFASKERVQRHMLVHGPQKLKPLQCNMCTKRFLNNSALTCHIKAHSKITFECPICKEVFDHVLSHKEHVRSHCLNGVYSCPHCKKEFKEYSVIRKHIRAFHCDRKYPCLYCNKLFPTTDKLRMHLLKHSDHREFLCAACGKQFKRKDKLKEHTKRMHSDKEKNDSSVMVLMDNKLEESNQQSKRFMPKVSPTDYHRFIYKCHTCMVGFKRRGMLVNHLAKRHPDVRPDSVPELNLPILRATRDYYCQYCDKVYKSSSKRKAHILKNHPGLELPLSRCKDTADISGMLNPTFSQTVGSVTTNPHNCQWCHKQYASKAKLLQHQRNKHSDLLNKELKGNSRVSTSEDVSDPLLIGTTVHNVNNMKSDKTDVNEKNNNKEHLEAGSKNTTDEMPSEFLNTDGFDTTGILLNSKDKVDEPYSRDMLTEMGNNIHGEFRISQNGQCYRLVPVSSDQDSVIPVGDSVLRALLTTTTPVMNRSWSETTPFTSYVPPR